MPWELHVSFWSLFIIFFLPGFQQFLPKCDVSLSSSSSNNVGGRYNYRSQNGGPFVHKRNQDEYGVQALQPVNCGIFRANSCCSEHGSQSSFGTRRQFEELRGEPTVTIVAMNPPFMIHCSSSIISQQVAVINKTVSPCKICYHIFHRTL